MSQKQMYTNNLDIPLGMAVWLVNDDYDYKGDPNYFSATTLMRPIRHIVLGPRNDKAEPTDLEDLIARSMGNSIHAAVEKAWVENKEENLAKLGYPKKVIDKVLLNPPKDQDTTGYIPIYIEQRGYKKFGKYTIGGKFDMCIEGTLHDIKTTSAWSWVFGTNDEQYKIQGSIYRYIHQDIIKDDFIRIMFVFTDWQKSNTSSNGYPESRVMYKDIPLMTIEETEAWIKERIALIERFRDREESDLPYCTDEELWLTEPTYKYYANPDKTSGRSTKNFKDYLEAVNHMTIKGKGKGVIITVEAEPKRCGYCPAYEICKQKDLYFHD